MQYIKSHIKKDIKLRFRESVKCLKQRRPKVYKLVVLRHQY